MPYNTDVEWRHLYRYCAANSWIRAALPVFDFHCHSIVVGFMTMRKKPEASVSNEQYSTRFLSDSVIKKSLRIFGSETFLYEAINHLEGTIIIIVIEQKLSCPIFNFHTEV